MGIILEYLLVGLMWFLAFVALALIVVLAACVIHFEIIYALACLVGIIIVVAIMLAIGRHF